MTPALDRTPSGQLPASSSGRRLISRIASPFAPKTRNIADFSIELNDPHRQYSQGETVEGHVKLRIAKPTRLTHLVVCLHGYVQVYKTPGNPSNDSARASNGYLGTRKGGRFGEYFGNGFASLFEDEVVLCGDGRLAEGVYQFNFELEFPERALPSSILFERGTVSYSVTATLTRPTAMSPTTQCTHPVYLVERIDVARFYPPKARTITLEGLARKHRTRTQARKLIDPAERDQRGDSARMTDDRRDSQSSSSPSVQIENRSRRSPSPSEISFDSLGPTSPPESSNVSSRLSDVSKLNGSRASLPAKKITTTIESLNGGCLRGDFVHVKVNVSHTKYVKSLYGVIVTLYRQARVDMHPAIPVGPIEKGKEGKYEDYYPKSLTGLGGLSLSGAGSSHIFRKDLSQTVSPLIIDPNVLAVEVHSKVLVPEDAFPTISAVPGNMIDFRYYVEVVVDIQGKLSTQKATSSNVVGSTVATPGGMTSITQDRQPAFPQYGIPMLDTAPIRRDKGVISCTFEVVVGTRDSERRKGKRKVIADTDEGRQQQEAHRGSQSSQQGHVPHASSSAADQQGNYPDPYHLGHDQAELYEDEAPYYDESRPYPGGGYNNNNNLPALTLMPLIEDESALPEKERMRRAEARLLPSQPPDADPDAEWTMEGASAPYLPEEDPLEPSASYAAGSSTPRARGRSDPPDRIDGTNGDEKAELQRRYLQMEASAPPDDDHDGVHRHVWDGTAGSTSGSAPPTDGTSPRDGPVGRSAAPAGEDLEPSAPTFDDLYDNDDDDRNQLSHGDARPSPDLPRYER